MIVLLFLVWKLLKERWRQLRHTLFELICGVMVFFILIVVINDVLKEPTIKLNYLRSSPSVNILFAPINRLTEILMLDICSEQDVTPGHVGELIYCYGFPTIEEEALFLDEYNFPSNESIYVISFENLNGSDFPTSLNYTLSFVRGSERYKSRFYDLDRMDLIRTEANSTLYGNLQWSIDKTYLESQLGDTINHTLRIGESGKTSLTLDKRLILSLLILSTVLAPLPFFLYENSKIIAEKTSGMKDMIKLLGVTRNKLRISYLIDTVIISSVYAVCLTLILQSTQHPIVKYSSSIVIVITIVLYFLTLSAFTFMTSTITESNLFSDSLAILLYSIFFEVNYLWYSKSKDYKTMFVFLLPHAPVFVFWDEVIRLENLGEGVHFSNLFRTTTDSQQIPLALTWLAFVFQFMAIMMFSWYFDMVKPGRFGVAYRWYFLFQSKYWSKRKLSPIKTESTVIREDSNDLIYFEKEPENADIVIKLVNVTKEFEGFKQPYMLALDKVNLDVYRGEISVIVGIHGSGKSTLASIVAGLHGPSEGSVYINNYDTRARLKKVKKSVGYCPSSIMLFSYLTVRENVQFFEWLACTLVGDPDILILDEPTADVESEFKHLLWDLLLTLRKEKTILMTTSSLEEADALADRIALINRGRIKCYGSPAFLKAAAGIKINLTVNKNENNPPEEINRLIRAQSLTPEIDTSQIGPSVNETRMSVTLSAPEDKTACSRVFEALDTKRSQLGILAMEVGVVLQQVFFKLIEEEEDLDFLYSYDDTNVAQLKKMEAWELWWQRANILMHRALRFSVYDSHLFVILQFVLPLLSLVLCNLISNSDYINIHKYTFWDPKTPNVVFYESAQKELLRAEVIKPILHLYPTTSFIAAKALKSDFLNSSKQYASDNHDTYIFKMYDTHSDILIPSFSRFLNGINMFSNLYASTHLRTPNQTHIYTRHKILELKDSLKMPKNLYLCFGWAMMISFVAHIPLAPMILVSTEECKKGVRFRHRVSGCSPSLIWMSKMVIHFILYCVVLPVPAVLATAALDIDHTLDRPPFLLALFLLLILFGPAFLCHWYVLTFTYKGESPITIIYMVSMFFGLFAPLLLYFVQPTLETVPLVVSLLFYGFMLFSPSFAISVGLCTAAITARSNALCKMNFFLCPDKMVDSFYMKKEICCNSYSGTPLPYFSSTQTGLQELCILFLQIIIYWGILMGLHFNHLQLYYQKLKYALRTLFFKYKEVIALKNPRVIAEEEYVREKMALYKDMSREERMKEPDIMLVDNIKGGDMNYWKKIKGVTFSLQTKAGIAVLGRGDAGNNTTMSMIAGATMPSSGNIYANGYFLLSRHYLTNILEVSTLGMDEFQTGFQNLQTVAMLEGYNRVTAHTLATRFMKYMGLTMYENMLVDTYSAGCKYRLAISMAFLTSDRIVVVDKPYKHSDHHSRPLITRALKSLLNHNIACVIFEENISWKELEMLCQKMIIMDRGEMITVGSIRELRPMLSRGYTIVIKLKVDTACSFSSEIDVLAVLRCRKWLPKEDVHHVKHDLLQSFHTSNLVAEHISQLYFHIHDPERKINYSEILSKLEAMKNKYSVIEDYTISETSIMDILYRIEQQLHGNLQVSNTAKRIGW